MPESDRLQSNALLLKVIEDGDLKYRTVGNITDFDASSICRFCSGDRHPPLELWRKLFAATGDLRIPRFIHGDTGFVSVRVVPPDGFGDDTGAVRALAREMREHCEAIQRAADIVCDGIGPEDRRKLPLFEKEADEAINALFALKQYLVAQVGAACAPAARRAPRMTSSHTQHPTATGKGQPS